MGWFVRLGLHFTKRAERKADLLLQMYPRDQVPTQISQKLGKMNS